MSICVAERILNGMENAAAQLKITHKMGSQNDCDRIRYD